MENQSHKENELLEYAFKYAQRGWHVFPLHNVEKRGCSCGKDSCNSNGKHPRTPNGFKDATTDEKQIKEWWKRWPKANIGIRTGLISGISVLDIDPRNGGDISIQPEEPLNTLCVKTGGGGWHYYFKYSPLLKTANGLLSGIDLKNDGGYVIAPPSNHASGGVYIWEDEDEYFG